MERWNIGKPDVPQMTKQQFRFAAFEPARYIYSVGNLA